MSAQTYVIYDKYNGHIVCDIKDNKRTVKEIQGVEA